MKDYFINNTEDDKKKGSDILGNFLQTSENYVFLTGAGCSKESGGMLMSSLWIKFSSEITDFEKLKKIAGYKSGENIEDLLSCIKITETYNESMGKTADVKKGRILEMKLKIN